MSKVARSVTVYAIYVFALGARVVRAATREM